MKKENKIEKDTQPALAITAPGIWSRKLCFVLGNALYKSAKSKTKSTKPIIKRNEEIK